MSISNPFLRCLTLLKEHRCEYCAIGGFAVVMYGVQRFTPDINLIIEPTPDNIEALFRAALSAKFDVMGGTTLEQARQELLNTLPSATTVGKLAFLDPQAPGFQLQIMWGLPLSFEEIQADRVALQDEGNEFYVSSVESLALLKAQSPRAQDIYEAGVLAALHGLSTPIPGLEALNAGDSISQDVENFAGFRDEPVATKLEWLQLVLTQLGSFCVV